MARDLPLPQLLVPQVAAATIGPAETEQLAQALEAAIGSLEPEVTNA